MPREEWVHLIQTILTTPHNLGEFQFGPNWAFLFFLWRHVLAFPQWRGEADLIITQKLWVRVEIVLIVLFSWQGPNLCWLLNLKFIIDLRVVSDKHDPALTFAYLLYNSVAYSFVTHFDIRGPEIFESRNDSRLTSGRRSLKLWFFHGAFFGARAIEWRAI